MDRAGHAARSDVDVRQPDVTRQEHRIRQRGSVHYDGLAQSPGSKHAGDGRCRQPAGRLRPAIDRNRCEGKGPCIAACPQDVLALGPLDAGQRAGQSLLGRVRTFVHGGLQAQVLRPDDCLACGACVEVCPERAIRLVRGAA